MASRDGGISDTKLLSHAIGGCLLNTVKTKRRDTVKNLEWISQQSLTPGINIWTIDDVATAREAP